MSTPAVSCPNLDSAREEIAGQPGPVGPEAFLASLEGELKRLAVEGGFIAIVLHLAMLEWLGGERLSALLDRAAAASAAGELWVAPCATIADHVLADPGAFQGGTSLDSASWAGG